jgi:hypothetical protein
MNKIELNNKLLQLKAARNYESTYSVEQEIVLENKLAEFESRKNKITPMKPPKNIANLSNKKNAFKAPKGNFIPDKTLLHDEAEENGRAKKRDEMRIAKAGLLEDLSYFN